jgi:hypothetical protein
MVTMTWPASSRVKPSNTPSSAKNMSSPKPVTTPGTMSGDRNKDESMALPLNSY